VQRWVAVCLEWRRNDKPDTRLEVKFASGGGNKNNETLGGIGDNP